MGMKKPPSKIDGANVLEWAWSGETPFGEIRYENGEIAAKIFGLAICEYPKDKRVYRFSCNLDWESEQDSDYHSVEEAKKHLPQQYQDIKVTWNAFR